MSQFLIVDLHYKGNTYHSWLNKGLKPEGYVRYVYIFSILLFEYICYVTIRSLIVYKRNGNYSLPICLQAFGPKFKMFLSNIHIYFLN